MNESFLFRYDPGLIEEAVFLAQRSGQIAGDFGRQRNHIYDIADPEVRDKLFTKLYESWFAQLGLGEPIEQAFREQPLLLSKVNVCFVARTTRAADEGAELFVRRDENFDGGPHRTVRILLRPQALLSRDELLAFLRHELFHIADMLDPAYGYEPSLPNTGVGPAYDQLLTNRYRLLWNITIDGRMLRRSWIPPAVRVRDLGLFAEAFPRVHDAAGELFTMFFDRETHTHDELVAFASNPQAALPSNSASAGSRCPVCGFPSHSFESAPEQLAAETVTAIRQDFPHWEPSAGICRQCADLYRVHRQSMEAAKLLPGAVADSANNGHANGSLDRQ